MARKVGILSIQLTIKIIFTNVAGSLLNSQTISNRSEQPTNPENCGLACERNRQRVMKRITQTIRSGSKDSLKFCA